MAVVTEGATMKLKNQPRHVLLGLARKHWKQIKGYLGEEKIAEIKKALAGNTEPEEPKKVTIGVMEGGPDALNRLRAGLKEGLKQAVKVNAETEARWKQAREQSEPVCCFCHKPKCKCCYLIQGYAPDKRPIFICSDCILHSVRILQSNKVKIGPTF